MVVVVLVAEGVGTEGREVVTAGDRRRGAETTSCGKRTDTVRVISPAAPARVFYQRVSMGNGARNENKTWGLEERRGTEGVNI